MKFTHGAQVVETIAGKKVIKSSGAGATALVPFFTAGNGSPLFPAGILCRNSPPRFRPPSHSNRSENTPQKGHCQADSGSDSVLFL